MCCYITYILPNTLSREQIESAFALEKIRLRQYEPNVEIPGMGDDELCWVRANDCDCGNSIGIQTLENADEVDPAEITRTRYKRKGWSDAKIARALNDMKQAAHAHTREEDSVSRVVLHLFTKTELQQIKLFWHYYSGNIDQEKFAVAAERNSRDGPLTTVLEQLPENHLLQVTRPGG